jgi:hypothetical protein
MSFYASAARTSIFHDGIPPKDREVLTPMVADENTTFSVMTHGKQQEQMHNVLTNVAYP